MNLSPQHHDQDWEKQLHVGLGVAPAPDFNAWREKYPDAMTALMPVVSYIQPSSIHKLLNRKNTMTTLKLAAALLLIVGGFLWLGPDNGTLSQSAFANPIPGVDNVQTMTWTTTFYIRCSSKDGKKSCIKKERRLYAYRHPGQYRETSLDEAGKPYSIHITDHRAGRMLTLDLKEKKAVLKIPPLPRDARGPFAWVGDVIRKKVGISLQGQKEIDHIQANIVRKITRRGKNQVELHADYLFDLKTKQLVGIWSQDEAGLEFDTVIEGNDIPMKQWYLHIAGGFLVHEIVLDTKLAAADFSLDPPTDFDFEKLAKPTVTEDEMIAYLGAAARFNDGNFLLRRTWCLTAKNSMLRAIRSRKIVRKWNKQ